MSDDPRPETGHNGGHPGRPTGEPDRTAGGSPPEPRRDGLPQSSLSAGRVASIRQRIARGTYDSADVLRVVARRILGSGDLRI